MRRKKYLFVFCMLAAIAASCGMFAKLYAGFRGSGGGLRVVTSFYPVYIAALNVAGEDGTVSLENLSEPQTGCLHDYQLTPGDMELLSQADLFLVNGGGIESFLADVGEAYPALNVVRVSEGLELLDSEGAQADEGAAEELEGKNAHCWMDTELYAQMVWNIADALSEADESHAQGYRENARRYCGKIGGLTSQIEEIRKEVLRKGSRTSVILLHEAFAYTAAQCGFGTAYCINLDEERQLGAGEVAEAIKAAESDGVSAVFAERQYGEAMAGTLEAEAGCSVYYLDSLVRGEYRADSYLSGMQENIDSIKAAWEEMR